MKNLFLLLCISLVSMTTALADETTGFSFNWAKTIDSNSSDSPRTLNFSSDGNILALANFGSTSDTEVRFDGTAIGDGAPYEGSSANNNVLFAKITPDGELLWKVISNWGDFSAANSSFAPTADGGAIIVMKMRHTNRDAAGNGILLALNDATGNAIELKWEKPADLWAYQGVMARIDGDGKVLWTKLISVDTSAQPAATSESAKLGTTDGADFKTISVDEDGNIYLGVSLRKTVTFSSSTGDNVDIEPTNTANWNGSSTSDAGNMCIVKLDSEGNYVDHFMPEGNTGVESIHGMRIDGNNIYFVATATSPESGNGNLTIGSTSLALTEFDDIVLGSINTDMEPNWAVCYPAYGCIEDQKHTTQVKNLNLIDGYLYVTGAVKGGFGNDNSGENFTTVGKSLEGFIIKADAENGNWIAGAAHGEGISGYFASIKAGEDIYAYGYTLSQAVYVRRFLPETSSLEEPINLVTGGGALTAWDAIADTENIYSFSRCNSNESSFLGSDFTTTTTGWGAILSSFALSSSSVGDIAAGNDAQFRAIGGNNEIIVSLAVPADIKVYNLSGICVADINASAGTTSIPVAQGFYIVNGVKVLVR